MRESLPSSSGGLPSRTSAEHFHPSVFTYLCTSVDQASPSTAPSVFHMPFPRAGPEPIPVRPLPHLHMLRRRVPQRRGCRVHVIVARRPRQGRRGCYKRRGQAGSAGSSALPQLGFDLRPAGVLLPVTHTYFNHTTHTMGLQQIALDLYSDIDFNDKKFQSTYPFRRRQTLRVHTRLAATAACWKAGWCLLSSGGQSSASNLQHKLPAPATKAKIPPGIMFSPEMGVRAGPQRQTRRCRAMKAPAVKIRA